MGYVERWLDAAVSMELIAHGEGGLLVVGRVGVELGILEDDEQVARLLQAVYSVLMADTMIPFFKTGERPGYSVVSKFENLSPHYGFIFEALYGPVWDTEVAGNLACLRELIDRGGSCADFQCGNGWLLRRILAAGENISCTGITNARVADAHSVEGIRYSGTDEFWTEERLYDIIFLNKVVHHFGDELAANLERLADRLKPGGSLVIWEFNWPKTGCALNGVFDDRSFLNLIEYCQNAGYLSLETIESKLRGLHLQVDHFLVKQSLEVVVTARRA